MNESWLGEMIDAALEDPPESRREPDFAALKNTVPVSRGEWSTRSRPPWLIPAAAAILAAALATPVGISIGHHLEERQINREIQSLFVDELIGGSLFEEGLTSGGEGILEDPLFHTVPEIFSIEG